MEKEKSKPQEKTLEENLKDKVWVNYNLLVKLENLSQIGMAILNELRMQRGLKQEKEEREGTFGRK